MDATQSSSSPPSPLWSPPESPDPPSDPLESPEPGPLDSDPPESPEPGPLDSDPGLEFERDVESPPWLSPGSVPSPLPPLP